MSDNQINTELKFGNQAIDFATLPAISQLALARRGLAHLLGNEQSAKIGPNSAWFKNFKEANEGREPTEDEIASAKADFQAKAIESLTAGTIGANVRGPSIDPFEAIVRRLAKAEVVATLKANNIKPPKGDETVTFAGGVTRTMDQMIDRKIDQKRDVFEKEAKKIQADQKKKAEAAKATAEAAKGKGEVSPEDLGL